MKLASKIFLASALVMLVLVAVGIWSVRAVGHLAAVNREIATRAVPAVTRAALAYDAVRSLVRLEARLLVLGDARYAALWDEQAARAREELDALPRLLTTAEERLRFEQAVEAFGRYEAAVREARTWLAAGQRQLALRRSETVARGHAEATQTALEALMTATHAAGRRAQAEAARLEARTWTTVFVALGSGFVLALVVTAVIAHRLTRRLRRLAEATAAVAAGRFREPVPETGGDELAGLARAFNAMAADLRQLDRLKETFLATVSHELRSPLTSVREAAHLLRDEIAGPLGPKQARLVGIIETSSERLLRLVNQILDLSRLKAGRLPMAWRPVDLVRVVERAVEELRPQATEAGVALAIEHAGQRFDLVGDEDKLVQVVVNLVANGIRFTPAGGRVTARVVDAGRELELVVEDTGAGIPPAALARLFEMYQQAHPERGGTGLGLAIVRGFVEAHGGHVSVESQEGKGSRFTVVLPRRGEAA
jgi:signal transduction histidine kinase